MAKTSFAPSGLGREHQSKVGAVGGKHPQVGPAAVKTAPAMPKAPPKMKKMK